MRHDGGRKNQKEKLVRLSKKDGKKILEAQRKDTEDFAKKFSERLRKDDLYHNGGGEE